VVKINFVPVPGGTVTIDGKPVVVKPYYIATTETPWEAFDAFTSSGPPSPPYDQTKFAPDAVARPSRSYILPDLGWGHHGYPVINVSFDNVTMFCRWLAKETKKKYRLPTEAEWQWAAQGADAKLNAPVPAKLGDSAWFADNSGGMTHPVGKKAASSLGLYDVFGNVGEWATDAAGEMILCGPTFEDKAAEYKVTRRQKFEPSWQETDPQIPKSRWWLADAPFAGFRIVCEP